MALDPAFMHNEYLVRRKVFKLFGGAFHVYDKTQNLVCYSKQKAFKLREDFRIYRDEAQTQELLTIKTPQILDLGATYHIKDSTTGEDVGALRRKALKSIIRDEWEILSPDGQVLGKMTEQSMAGAIISRFVNLVPQKYAVLDANERKVADVKQHFNPFVLKYTIGITFPDTAIDRRLILAAGILLAGIERRQN